MVKVITWRCKRNSDVGKESEKLYYCLKRTGMVDRKAFVNYLTQKISKGSREGLISNNDFKIRTAAVINYLQKTGKSVVFRI